MSEKMFQLCCNELEIDIIVLDLSKRLPFSLKRTAVSHAVERGIFFEITYSASLRDPLARRTLISNAQALVELSKGRNVIVSSEAVSAFDVRAPYDIINLFVWTPLHMYKY